jgi:hypothetical protein
VSKFTYISNRFIVPGIKAGGLRLAFDIEADALLDDATVVHCIVVANLDSDQIDEYGPEQITAGLEHLARADYLTGHNIGNYDLPLLRRLHGWQPKPDCSIGDTLIIGRLILPNVADLDDQAAAMGDPPLRKLRGRYSLEAWGSRLGIAKTGTDITDWSRWTAEMQERCVGDVVICKALWHFLQPDGYSQEALVLEHKVAAICDAITVTGVPFDIAAAERLRQQWTMRLSELETHLAQQFPGVKLSSRMQIGALLEAKGWVPERRTEKTQQPKIDDELLETIPALYPEFAGLGAHFTLERRLAQLAMVRRRGARLSLMMDAFMAASCTSARRTAAPNISNRISRKCPTRKRERRSAPNAAPCFKRATIGRLSPPIKPGCRIGASRIISPASMAAPTPRRSSTARATIHTG